MKARIEGSILFIAQDDVPPFKKGGSVVRNNYFWALKAIAAHTSRMRDWEYDAEVWIALQRVLLAFGESGYLGMNETLLEFSTDQEIPSVLKPVATWL